MKLRRASTPLFLVLLGAVLGSGCGEGGSGGGTTVVATTGVLADVVRNVAGPEVEVVQLIPDGANAHGFQASARDRQALDDATLLVANGAGLEQGLPLDGIEAPRWVLAEQAGPPLGFGEGGEGTTGGEDPHVWMDPSRVASALSSLAAALAEADPEHARRYRARARRYAGRLERLDREITEQLSTIPVSHRALITSHDALAYFAERYELEVIATPFPASGPAAEPSAARLAEVQRAIEERAVPAVFAQATDDAETLAALARASGAEIVDDLLVASPGLAGGYEEMLRRDALLIASALR